MFSVAICDDSPNIQQELSQFVEKSLENKSTEYEILAFSNGEELFSWLNDNDSEIELLFLDIEMPGLTGVEIKSHLEKNDKVKRVVFATSHYENMQEAFGAKVIGFMLKPLKYEEVEKRVENAFEEYRDDVLIEIAQDTFVKKSEISFIKSEGNYCDFYCVDGKVFKAIRNPLSHYKNLFGENFIQVHKSYIVNACDIKKRNKGVVMLSNNVEIPMGRSYLDSFKAQYREVALNIAKGRL